MKQLYKIKKNQERQLLFQVWVSESKDLFEDCKAQLILSASTYKRYDEDGKRRHWCRNVIPHVMCLLRIKIPLITLRLKTNSTPLR